MDILDQRLEIRAEPRKLLGLLALGVVMVAGSLAVAIGDWHTDSFKRLVGWVGVVFFGAIMVLLIGQLIQAKRPIIVLDRNGVWDRRVSRKPVPWVEIMVIGTFLVRGQSCILIKVAPEVEAAVGLTRVAKMTRKANARQKADGLLISPTGLATDLGVLLQEIIARRQAVHELAMRDLELQGA